MASHSFVDHPGVIQAFLEHVNRGQSPAQPPADNSKKERHNRTCGIEALEPVRPYVCPQDEQDVPTGDESTCDRSEFHEGSAVRPWVPREGITNAGLENRAHISSPQPKECGGSIKPIDDHESCALANMNGVQKSVIARQLEAKRGYGTGSMDMYDSVVEQFRRDHQATVATKPKHIDVELTLPLDSPNRTASNAERSEVTAPPPVDVDVVTETLGDVSINEHITSPSSVPEAKDRAISRVEVAFPENDHLPVEEGGHTIKVEFHPPEDVEPPTSAPQTTCCPSVAIAADTDAHTRDDIQGREPDQKPPPTEAGAGAQEQVDERDHSDLDFIKAWGAKPERRSTKPHVRTIVLRGLPSSASPTLALSLVYGGVVEAIRLHRGPDDQLDAHICLVSADACRAFYDKHQSGIEVRFKAKRYTVRVEMGSHVDMLSGVMRGYLDCGATRVVTVDCVDDDWTLVTLRNLAEGKAKSRQLEGLNDSFREDVRTVTFRFTNIHDAVMFKSTLHKSGDWAGCNIQFGQDPCEKATGMHFD